MEECNRKEESGREKEVNKGEKGKIGNWERVEGKREEEKRAGKNGDRKKKCGI